MEDRFCKYCGEKLPKKNKMFCNSKCQMNFKKGMKGEKISGLERSNRNYEVKIRLSIDEKNKIEIKSKDLGLRLSPYMRMISLYGIRIPEQILL